MEKIKTTILIFLIIFALIIMDILTKKQMKRLDIKIS